MASRYYSGEDVHWYNPGDWLPQPHGYGSKQHYSGDLKTYFKEKTGSNTVEDNPDHIKAFVEALGKKETGYLQKKDTKK